jgi:outer membrane protein assembly factor BamB
MRFCLLRVSLTLVVNLCGAMIGAASSAGADADWPQLRGPTGRGISDAKGLPTKWSATENIAWKTELPGAGASTPIVVGGKIYVTCYRGYNMPGERGGSQENLERLLVCVSPADGKVLW